MTNQFWRSGCVADRSIDRARGGKPWSYEGGCRGTFQAKIRNVGLSHALKSLWRIRRPPLMSSFLKHIDKVGPNPNDQFLDLALFVGDRLGHLHELTLAFIADLIDPAAQGVGTYIQRCAHVRHCTFIVDDQKREPAASTRGNRSFFRSWILLSGELISPLSGVRKHQASSHSLLQAGKEHEYHQIAGKDGQASVSADELADLPEIRQLAELCAKCGLDQECLAARNCRPWQDRTPISMPRVENEAVKSKHKCDLKVSFRRSHLLSSAKPRHGVHLNFRGLHCPSVSSVDTRALPVPEEFL